MDATSWLFEDIVIRRSFYNAYYVAMFAIMPLAAYLAVRYNFRRFSLLLWLNSGLIGLLWELTLFLLGLRHYNPGFIPPLELAYHALTEAGPGLVIMTIAADRWGIVDLGRFHDAGDGRARKVDEKRRGTKGTGEGGADGRGMGGRAAAKASKDGPDGRAAPPSKGLDDVTRGRGTDKTVDGRAGGRSTSDVRQQASRGVEA